MSIEMIVNRYTNWYSIVDSGVDPFFLSIVLLEKLEKNMKRGLNYNRIDLINVLSKRNSNESLDALDKAIVILSSRALIEITYEKELVSKIFITQLGKEVLDNYRKEL